jgi:drug/metabolite transporter (DMT)-like permease
MIQNSTETQHLHSTKIWPACAIATTVLTWASAFPAIRYCLRELPPLPLASLRFTLAAVVALLWLAWSRPSIPSRRDLGMIVVCGALGIAAYNMLLNSGQTTVSPGAASFIVNTQPLFMVFLAVLFLGERLNVWSWLGAAIGFSGVALIASGQPGGLSFGTGASLIVAAAFCAAIYSVIQRSLVSRLGALQFTSLVIIAGALLLAAWLPAGIEAIRQASAGTIFALLFLAIVPAWIGLVCWTISIKFFGAARAGLFLFLIPPCAVLISWIFLGERPELVTLLGGSITITGVALVNLMGRVKQEVKLNAKGG